MIPDELRRVEKELDDTGNIARACNRMVKLADAWEADRKRLEKAEREGTILLGMVAEEIGFERAQRIWDRLAALAPNEKKEENET